MAKASKNIIPLSKEEYLKLLEAYQKIGEVLNFKKMKKSPSLKSLYGIWKGVKVDKEDFEKAKNLCLKLLYEIHC